MTKNANFMEMLKDAMELGLTKEEAMSFVKECLALTNTVTTVGGNTTKKPTGAKAPTSKKTKSSKKSKTNTDFDRKLYEAKARELGVYNEEHGKVTATVENGKVLRTSQENRKLVYEAMGI